MAKQTIFPNWYQLLRVQLPPRVREELEQRFTIHRDGYVRWYRGAVRFVCGKSVAPDQVEDRWTDKKRAIDGRLGDPRAKGAPHTLRQAAGEYYDYLDQCVKTGRPKPLSPVTRNDYIQTLTRFGRCVGGEKPLTDFGPAEFKKFAALLAEYAPNDTPSCCFFRTFTVTTR